MKVVVVWATPAIQDLVEVDVPDGATVGDAVERSGLVAHYRLDAAKLGFAVFGRRASAQLAVTDGDRIELTRPLEVDPKAARLARARTQPLTKALRRAKAPRSS